MVRYFEKPVHILGIVLATHVTLALGFDESTFSSVQNQGVFLSYAEFTYYSYKGYSIGEDYTRSNCFSDLATKLVQGDFPAGTYGVNYQAWDPFHCAFLTTSISSPINLGFEYPRTWNDDFTYLFDGT
ncbi:MAG: hypothetical protein QF704_11145, partial [Anaerolineales bacterium]|nr:hypothetical protein [Anaerolineales bacterium]